MIKPFELKVRDPKGKSKIVEWQGADGIDAAHRYVASHPGTSVYAWREGNRHGIFPIVDTRHLHRQIIEPGDRRSKGRRS